MSPDPRAREVIAERLARTVGDEPRRRVRLMLDLQADSPEELADALDDIATRVMRKDLGPQGASGGVTRGYSYTYDDDPEWTHDRYFEAISR